MHRRHDDLSATDRPPALPLALITLAAEDWYETVDFYRDVLGLTPVWLDRRHSRARFHIAPGLLLEVHSGGWGADGPKSARENPMSLCFRVPSVERAAVQLEGSGACLLSEPAHGLLALMDPEGNRVYLFEGDDVPLVPDGWELQAPEDQ